MHSNLIYILTAWIVTFAIRTLPLTLIRKPIRNRFLKSFLYYVPYVTLSVMTFPAILNTTGNILCGLGALSVGIVLAWMNKGLPVVACACTVTVLILEFIL